jgi:hypothetical protein
VQAQRTVAAQPDISFNKPFASACGQDAAARAACCTHTCALTLAECASRAPTPACNVAAHVFRNCTSSHETTAVQRSRRRHGSLPCGCSAGVHLRESHRKLVTSEREAMVRLSPADGCVGRLLNHKLRKVTAGASAVPGCNSKMSRNCRKSSTEMDLLPVMLLLGGSAHCAPRHSAADVRRSAPAHEYQPKLSCNISGIFFTCKVL